ncbi:DUF6232 family protein [Caballeronia sp. LZ043]|uniref:DUF6232 family protein n=1 Tax=Caballeronia sp. LZ043 TaxID=3038569 RepID=UPI00285BD3BD|nr:DUF6232 family protein [Caballeronia sp. LZ043]MDR5824735.1 DUF6232 family protein [Caballeronia sp. LZ043]
MFYDDGAVRVTNARFIVPGQTFAMSGITSVQHWRTPRKWLFGVLLIAVAVPMLLSGLVLISNGESVGPLTLGGIIAALGAYLLWRGRPQSQVRLRSSSGETKAFVTYDDAQVARIVLALNDAIVARG